MSVHRGWIAAAVLGAACGGRDAGAGDWQFHVDTLGPEAGGGTRQISWLRVSGQEGSPGAERSRAVILSFDCFKGNASSTIMTDQALRQGTAEIELRLDSAAPRRIPAFAGTTPTGGKVVLTMALDSVLALLGGHQQARIEYADGAGSSRTLATFPVAGLERHRASFLATCSGSATAPR